MNRCQAAPALRRVRAFLLFLPLLAGCAFAAGQEQVPRPASTPIKVDVEMVLVNISVSDRESRPVGNLRREDFEILEDGIPQEIAYFGRDELPLHLALVVDVSGSVIPLLPQIKLAANEAMTTMKPEDNVALFSFARQVRRVVDYTADHRRVVDAISRLRAGGGTALIDALYVPARSMQALPRDRRRIIVMISDNEGMPFNQHPEKRAIEEAQEAGAAVYGIQIKPADSGLRWVIPTGGLSRRLMKALKETGDMKKFAAETGGLVLSTEKNRGVGPAFQQLMQRVAAQHYAGYFSKNSRRDGSVRKILVRLSQEGKKRLGNARISHRRAYIAPAQTAEKTPPRGYSIPLIDLAGESRRQTIVDREEGQYLGHPTTVVLEDGRTLLAVYPKGHGKGAILFKRSPDGGRTWSERLTVPDNWSTSQETPTLYRTLDPAGKRYLVLFSGLYPVRMAVSADEGVSWSPLQPVGDFGGIVAMSDLVRLRDGRYAAFFHDDGRFFRNENRRGPFLVYQTISPDGGLTWGPPKVIAEHPTAHLCEPGAVRSPDGRQIALLLRENSRQMNSFVIFSNDEGDSWSTPAELTGALTGDRHVARYDQDHRLVVTFRDTTLESPTWGDWVAWIGRYEDILNRREGQYRVRLMDNKKDADCCYAGLERMRDGNFVATTYGHWQEGQSPYIVSVRFKLSEIDARRAAPR